jgi:polyhydroxyalkanoate synthase subunit PhaE
MENTTKNMFETLADMQKQAVETMNNAAKTMQENISNGNNLNMDSETFKKWYDSQMGWFNQVANEKNNMNKGMEFFTNYMNKQNEMAKQWQEMSQNMMPNMNNNIDMKAKMDNMTNVFESWKNTMTESYNEMMKNFNNGETKNNFADMFNNSEMYMKTFQFFMPMMKSLNDKTFTPETFKNMFNTEAYKGMMDKMFNMNPDLMKNFNENQMMASMKENMFKMMDASKSNFDNMKNNMNMGNMNSSNPFMENITNSYNQMYSQMQTSMAPLTKLFGNNSNMMAMETMKDLTEMMAAYNTKNNQMQYMMYTTGMKAMDEVSENMYAKVKNGEDVKEFADVYKNWLNTNDKHFVALFETPEYSKLMSEVSALQLNLKGKMEKQVEKSLEKLPLVNRTEMDELYKTVQTLKKRIASLEKEIDNVTTSETADIAPKATAKKTAKNA